MTQRRVRATVTPLGNDAERLQRVLDRRAIALFVDRPALVDAAQRGPDAGQPTVLERVCARAPRAQALPRGDADWRLLVGRTLSRLYRSPESGALFAAHFGTPETPKAEFHRRAARPAQALTGQAADLP